MVRILLVSSLVFLTGCSTTAVRSNGETFKITGTGWAKWEDGSEIHGEPMIKLPALPDLKYEN